MSTTEGNVLFDLAARVDRLAPCHRRPDKMTEDKSEISSKLRELGRSYAPPRPEEPRPIRNRFDRSTTITDRNGRSVRVEVRRRVLAG